MKSLPDLFLGSPGRFSFEERLFHFCTLLGVTLTALGAAMDFSYGGNSAWVNLVFIGVWVLTYLLSRFKGQFHPVAVVSLSVLVFAFYPYQWIISGGLEGVLPFYSIVFLLIVCILLRGAARVCLVVSLLGVTAGLLLYDMARGALPPGAVWLPDGAIHLLIILGATAALAVVYSGLYLREKQRGEAYARELQENYRQQLYSMETLEEAVDRLKAQRHDWNNQLGVLYGLLADGQGEEALDYAALLTKKAKGYRTLVPIPYSMLRAMLSYKLSAAGEDGVDLRLHIAVPPGLPLPQADLTVILGNLLDNALEACAALPWDDRWLELRMDYEPDYLVIQVRNPAKDPLSGGLGRSSKRDQESHGFGLRNIEYLVEKHSGFLRLTPGEGVFEVSLAILIKPPPKNRSIPPIG